MDENKSIERLKALIEQRGTTQADVAMQVGITRQHLGAILNGKYFCGKKTAKKLSDWAGPDSGVSVLELMGF